MPSLITRKKNSSITIKKYTPLILFYFKCNLMTRQNKKQNTHFKIKQKQQWILD